MDGIKESLAAKVVEAGGRLTVRSALNPILWLCAIITIPALIAIGVHSTPPTWLIVLACAPVITAILGFLFLLFFDRDKLQSEEYQLRKRSLELIEQKGDAGPIVTSNIESIENPKKRPLRAPTKGDKS